MKKKTMLFISVSLILLCLCSLSLAGEGKRLDLTLRDGKISADIHNVSLKEVANEIGRRWGILIELYGRVDQDGLVSAKFEGLSVLDSLFRLFRGTNFLYIEGEKLYVLGFGEEVLRKEARQAIPGPSSQDLSRERGLSSMPEVRREGLQKSTRTSMNSGLRGEERGGNWASFRRGGAERYGGESSLAGEVQNVGEVNRSKDSREIGASFTTSIVLEARGEVISALSSDIIYDSNLLGNPRVSLGESGMQAEKDVIYNEVRPGLLRVGVVGLNQKAISDGVAAYVTFDVLREGQISFTHQPTASDPHGNLVPVTFRDGKITMGK